MASSDEPISWFRNTAPYINAHRGSTFVVLLPGELQAAGALPRVLQDLALLASLGVKLVVVFGSRPQIDAHLKNQGLESRYENGLRVTTPEMMPALRQVVGSQRHEIEAQLSMGLPNSPMRGANLRAISGNFVVAKPVGVHGGVDFQLAGEVRRVDVEGIKEVLSARALVLLSVLGCSPSGENFNMSVQDVARAAARELEAEKLIVLCDRDGIHDAKGTLIRQCTAAFLDGNTLESESDRSLLKLGVDACRGGVNRCHIVSYTNPDALLAELFTVDGSGTLVTGTDYEQTRWATIQDVAGVLELIQPLEESGVLLKRSRELLENEITQFRLMERDGRITACAALYPYRESQMGELACIVTHPDYRNNKRAQLVLRELEEEALAQGLNLLFVLTTQTAHWFLEQGFTETTRDSLPAERKALYNLQRNSKVFVKHIGKPC
ncbi:MAG: amino-acid N-acetyltransferase [Pseudomonadota bacterium]